MEHVHHRHQHNYTSGVKTMVKTSQRPAPGPGKRRKRIQAGGKMVMYRHIHKIDKVIRMLRTAGALSSNAGGVIAFFAANSAAVTSSPDWTNYSQEYANYRVRKVNFRFFPSTVNATSTTGPYQGVLAMSRYWGLAPNNQSTMFQDNEVIFLSTLQEGTVTTNYLGYLDAQEWTPVGTAIAADRTYGITGITPASTSGLAVSSQIYSYIFEYETEFLDAY